MANEVVLDVAEGIGAFVSDLVDLVEETGLDPQSRLSAGALNGLQRRFLGVEDGTAQRALDVAEQAVLDGVPLGGYRAGSGRCAGVGPSVR